MKRIAVLASGSGSNFQALTEYFRQTAAAEVAVLICNTADAPCLDRAAQLGVTCVCRSPKEFAGRAAYDTWIADVCRAHDVGFVVLAGYMRILGEPMLAAFPNRILNIHPALLPSFPGCRGVEDAVAYGVRVAGITIHVVDAGVDTGPILYQCPVPVLTGDSLETLRRRIAFVEHQAYPRVVEAYLDGRVTLQGRRAVWKEELPWVNGS